MLVARVIFPALLLLKVLLAAAAVSAQQPDPPTHLVDDPSALVRLELTDGTVLIGTIVREDSSGIVLRTMGGAEVSASPAQVRSRTPYAGVVRGGRVLRRDPNPTRLLFGPTARSLRRGQGYLAVYEIVLPFVAYGPGAGVTLSGGTVFAPGAILDVFYVAPKFTVLEGAGGAAAVGGFVVATSESVTACSETQCTENDEILWGALPFVVGTLGDGGRAVTAGLSVPVGKEGIGASALMMLGGELQVSNSIKLLTENYAVFADGAVHLLVGGGVRFFGERLAADVGVFVAPETIGDTDIVPFAPWLGLSYGFGR